MKKNYVLALSLISAGLAAQPTITSVVVPQVGYVYNMASDTTATDLPTFTVSAGSASAQTWDYTNMFNNVYGETTSFVAPSTGAGSSNFPNATVAVQQSNMTDWIYFIGNSNGLFIDGAHVVQQGSAVDIDLTPNQVFLPTPSTYGYNNQANSTATFTTVASGYTVMVNHYADRTVSGDAFGSLTTPTSTYPNTLRIKTYEKTIDSVFFYILGSWNFALRQTDTTTTYMWVQNSQDAQLMQINLNKANAVTKASYLSSFSNGIATYSNADAGFNLYPNPASNVTYLSYENKNSGPVSLQLFDMNGRMLGDLLNENQAIGKHKVMINLESMHLPKGLYFVQFRNSEGTQNGKLSVN